MKNLLTSVVLFILFSGVVMAQSIYFRAGTGYGLPIATALIGENRSETYTQGGASSNSVKGVNASYGSGVNLNFALGYELNENFILDLNFQYLMGRNFKTSDTYSSDFGNGYIATQNDVTTTSSTGIFLNPSIIFSAGFGKAAPYGRFGLFAGSPTVTGDRSYYYDVDGISSGESKWEYTKGLALGFQGAVGMNWKLTEKLDLFTELNFISMTYYAGEYKLTQDVSNGYDNLVNMAVSSKETVYEKKFDPSKANIDSTKPTTALRESTPFSSLSFQAGIRFSLWKLAE